MTDLTIQSPPSNNATLTTNTTTATSPSNYFQISSNFRRRSSASNLSPRNQQQQQQSNNNFEFTSPTQQINVSNRNSVSLYLIPPPSLSVPQLSNSKYATNLTVTTPMFEMINSFTLTTVFSQMIVHANSQSTILEERASIVSSFVSNTNSEVKLPISVLEISQLYSILLVVIKNIQDSQKKIIELVEWQKSLRQLGVLPILVFQNTKQELDEFLEGNQWNGYSIDVNNMMRVSDLNFELTKQLFENTNSPVSNEQEFDREIVESKMFLIRNGSLVWESSTKPEDQVIGTILSTVVLKLPWYAMSTDEISSDESQHALPPPPQPFNVNNSLNNLNQSYKSSCSLSSGGLRNSIRLENSGATSPSNSTTSQGGVSASLRIGSLVHDHNSFIVPAGLSLHGAMSVLHTISNNFGMSEDEVSCDDFQFPENQNHEMINENNFEYNSITNEEKQAKPNGQPTPIDQIDNEMTFTPKSLSNTNTTNTTITMSNQFGQKEQSFISTNTNNTTSSDKMTHQTLGTPLLGADSRYCSSMASMNSTFIETSASSLDLTTLMMPPSPNSMSLSSSSSPASAETLIQKRKQSIFQKLRGRNDIEKIAVEQQKLEKEMQDVKKKEIVSRSQNNLYATHTSNHQGGNNDGLPVRRSIFSYCFGRNSSSSSGQPSATTEKTLVMYDPVESHLSEMYQVMHDDMKRQYFKLFSLKQFNAENLLFWEDVKLFYKKIVLELKRQQVMKQRFSLKSSQIDVSQPPILSNVNMTRESIIELHDKIMKMAKYIAEKYLFEKDSVYCLNTSNKMIEQVRSRMSLEGLEFINISETIFDDVVTEIIKTVLPDMFCRFVLSNEYDEMQRVLQVSNKLF